MSFRQSKGATLGLVVSLLVVLVIIGIAWFSLSELLGGSRETLSATDAGTLSAARSLLAVSVDPTKGISNGLTSTPLSASAFSGLGVNMNAAAKDANGNTLALGAPDPVNGIYNILAYNRCAGLTLLIAMNAAEEGTPTAITNANQVISYLKNFATELNTNIIASGVRNTGSTGIAFQTIASQNNLAMNGVDSKIELTQNVMLTRVVTGAKSAVAPEQNGGKANVYFNSNLYANDKNLQDLINNAIYTSSTNIGGIVSRSQAGGDSFAPAYTTVAGGYQSNQPLVRAYYPIVIPGVNDGKGGNGSTPIYLTAVNPDSAPHLIDQSAFTLGDSANGGNDYAPVNAVWITTKTTRGGLNVTNGLACAIVGAIFNDYNISFPHGYIELVNLGGLPDNSPIPSSESIFNNQLYTGIFLANNGAFSTNEDLMQQWANYNNTNPRPLTTPSSQGMFGPDGNPATSAVLNGVTSLGGGAHAYPPEADYTMISGAGAMPQVAALLSAFEQAYPASNGQTGPSDVYTAVEYLKASVMAEFANGQTGAIQDPPGYTGLRLFNHDQAYPVAEGASARFTRTGTVTQLLAQVGDNPSSSTSITAQLLQRLRQIKPDATAADLNALFANNLLEMGTTFYVYLNNGILTMTQTLPPWAVAGASPDGTPQDLASTFQTIGLTVDPQGEEGLKNVMFEQTPNPTTSSIGKDEAVLTLGSGYNNLLAVVDFRESVGDFPLLANSTPTPPVPVAPVTPTPGPITTAPVTPAPGPITTAPVTPAPGPITTAPVTPSPSSPSPLSPTSPTPAPCDCTALGQAAEAQDQAIFNYDMYAAAHNPNWVPTSDPEWLALNQAFRRIAQAYHAGGCTGYDVQN